MQLWRATGRSWPIVHWSQQPRANNDLCTTHGRRHRRSQGRPPGQGGAAEGEAGGGAGRGYGGVSGRAALLTSGRSTCQTHPVAPPPRSKHRARAAHSRPRHRPDPAAAPSGRNNIRQKGPDEPAGCCGEQK